MKTPYWHSLLADPTNEVKRCFFGVAPGLGTVLGRAVWDFWGYLLECRSTFPLFPGLSGVGKEMLLCP
jgi:hypothetical protein